LNDDEANEEENCCKKPEVGSMNDFGDSSLKYSPNQSVEQSGSSTPLIVKSFTDCLTNREYRIDTPDSLPTLSKYYAKYIERA
jgi:hypothetical protein